MDAWLHDVMLNDVLDNVLPDDLDSEVGGPHADGDAMEVRIAA